MDESSTKRKSRKRGRSLIFKSFFPQTSSDDEAGGKMLASDDNLVYCDVSNNGGNGDQYAKMKSSPSRGRMSSLFKAVLFDTAMKKKKFRGKRASKPTIVPTNSTSPLDDKTTDNDSLNKNDPNTANVLETDNNSQNDASNANSLPQETDTSQTTSPTAANNSTKDSSNVVSSSSKNDTPPASSSTVESDTSNVSSQTLTERKVTSPVKPTVKKPPLPSGSRSLVKRNTEQDCKPVTLSNSTTCLCLFVVLVVFVSMVLWMRFRTNVTESTGIDSDQITNTVVGDEL